MADNKCKFYGKHGICNCELPAVIDCSVINNCHYKQLQALQSDINIKIDIIDSKNSEISKQCVEINRLEGVVKFMERRLKKPRTPEET